MMSNQWIYYCPVKVRYGWGSSRELSNLVAEYGTRVVLAGDPGVAALDFFKRIANDLAGCAVFTEIEPNPTVRNVDELTRLIRRQKADVVVAVGGGSVMDCAKAACCLARTEEPSVRAFHTEGRAFEQDGLPLIVVATTAGTGSEVTPISVLDDQEKGEKRPMVSSFFYPTLSVVDPELTCSLPLGITAATGLDALSHAVEAYWSKNHQPLCDLMAMEAARHIFKTLPLVYKDPSNREVRSAMSYAALLAGMAFQRPRTAMVHACSYPLSSRFRLSHGAACAFTLEFALKLNAPAMSGRMEVFANHCGFESINEMASAIRRLKEDGGLPCTLSEAGIPEDAVDVLIEESFNPVIKSNPVEVTPEHLRQMYKELAD